MRKYVYIMIALVLAGILSHLCYFRIDLTADKRYSVSTQTKSLLQQTNGEIEITLYLDGELNTGFARLQTAVKDMIHALQPYADIRLTIVNPLTMSEKEQYALQRDIQAQGWYPTMIYEKTRNGQQQQTLVYPYAKLTKGNKAVWVSLLQNVRGQSGAENLNQSIEQLEFTFVEAMQLLVQKERKKIVFLEGHGEWEECYTADVQNALSRYFDIYRGTITTAGNCLDEFAAVIVANPLEQFADEEKYIIDQYIMRGGKVLWLVDGTYASFETLSATGFTPVLPLDVNLTDLFFQYGFRINNHLVQDLQCVSIPVDVSLDPNQPQYQPLPWVYTPILLTSSLSPVTRSLMQVKATWPSDIEFVGNGDNQVRQVLLATSTASRVIGTPAEVDLEDITIEQQLFTTAFVPVAVAIEGTFNSLYAFLGKPEKVIDNRPTEKHSVPTRQIAVACGHVIYNDVERGESLPCGYDRYSKIQFGNRDFIVNSVLYLADNEGFMNLRQKTVPLRLLSEKALKEKQNLFTVLVFILPLALLLTIFLIVYITRKKRYIQ